MAEDQSHPSAAAAANQFSLALYRQLAKPSSAGSLIVSPFSIRGVLAMAYAGARGQTAAQMHASLALPQEDGSEHAALGALAAHVQSLPGARLEIASSLWPQDGFPLLTGYLDLLKSAYQAALISVDYISQTEAARLQINTWAEKHTSGKIQNLLPPGVLTPLTRLVLANAIYFKGTWAKPFDPQHTREEPFAGLDGFSRSLPMMRQTIQAGYAQNKDVQVLALPFEGRAFEMVFILPTQPDGLPALEENLTGKSLASLLTGLRSAEVQVLLPVFRLESMFDLKHPLQALGMQHAFNPRWADFSRMTGERDLYISEAVHKAYVEVNEEGAEAAAASAVVVAMRAVVKPPLVFRADHPFLFLIREAGSGLVLFLGRFGGSP